ncbi:MAG: SUMF1/EgtB/PvdO family nonheme iron enzyme, partial [Phenylobacterium sp.]|nr:SUMF1/EgtB/PvdO family nonheme iron enzyme [Phenylobacterium sp.]MCA6318158.1 SUMF1/EgtB/PvdO family nonheme iron enzyme [Phenylobacterium sp.]
METPGAHRPRISTRLPRPGWPGRGFREASVTDEPVRPPGEPPFPGMAWAPGGVFTMGSDRHYPEERPARAVRVDGFWMDLTPVTNRQF